MIKYENHSLFLQEEIATASKQSLQLIENLDKKVHKLCKRVDKKLKSVKISDEEYEEITLMRKAIEIITVRKVQLAMKNYDFVDQNIKMVDNEIALLEKEIKQHDENRDEDSSCLGEAVFEDCVMNNVVEKKRKQSVSLTSDYPNLPAEIVASIDPNEPIYCTCRRVSFGDMVACDNEDCDIEWFHYSCVNLLKKPRSEWLCPMCTIKLKL
jgi:hypothetical protein